jgi:hypothetical protein
MNSLYFNFLCRKFEISIKTRITHALSQFAILLMSIIFGVNLLKYDSKNGKILLT